MVAEAEVWFKDAFQSKIHLRQEFESLEPGMVVYACNPSYLEGKVREYQS
jgi:hypothetical protein